MVVEAKKTIVKVVDWRKFDAVGREEAEFASLVGMQSSCEGHSFVSDLIERRSE